ncbi:MAG: hypothetical protein ACRDJ4_02160 [Actinomycetota bacterium]
MDVRIEKAMAGDVEVRLVGDATPWCDWGGAQPAPSSIPDLDGLHTLGPEGTNCELAAHLWWELRGRPGKVGLHPTFEAAADAVLEERGSALLAPSTYPELHNLVYTHLCHLVLVDSFIAPSHSMVFALRPGVDMAESITLHPATIALAPRGIADRRFVDSNVLAARACAGGDTDACITTLVAASDQGLRVRRDFGQIPIAFTVHARIDAVVPQQGGVE